MSRTLRQASNSAHLLARRIAMGMRQDRIDAASNLSAAFLQCGMGVCTPNADDLNLSVMIIALSELLSRCLEELSSMTESLPLMDEPQKIKKEYVM